MDLITVSRKEGLAFNISVRGHEVTSDMSTGDGGADAGPSPAELLASSLGACTAMIVQTYCKNHGYEGDVEVSLTLQLADKPKRIERIVLDVEVPESVPEDKVETIKRVAEHCLVHETLKSPPGVDIEIT